jgi:hypothetical protein
MPFFCPLFNALENSLNRLNVYKTVLEPYFIKRGFLDKADQMSGPEGKFAAEKAI